MSHYAPLTWLIGNLIATTVFTVILIQVGKKRWAPLPFAGLLFIWTLGFIFGSD